MGDRTTKTAAEQLREQKLVKLVESAREKQRAGKTPTTAEIRAVDEAQTAANRRRDLPYLERMPKREFIAQFGGSSKVYLEWHRDRGFPWSPGEDYVDAMAAIRWLREAVAGGHAISDEQDHAARLKKAQADKAELELERMRGQLVDVDEILIDVGRVGAKLREGIEQLDVAGQETMLKKLGEAEAEIEHRKRDA